MNIEDGKYFRYVNIKLIEELNNYNIYFFKDSSSWWWINPNTKEWVIELQNDNNYWIEKTWGNKFKDKMVLSDEEFIELFENYLTRVMEKEINPSKNSSTWTEWGIPFINTPEENSPIIDIVLKEGILKNLTN